MPAPSRRRGPTGFRTHIEINRNIASEVGRSAAVVGGLEVLLHAIGERADEMCPVGTDDEHLPPGHEPGTLRDSRGEEVMVTPGGPFGVIFYTAFWAHMVHNGTSHSAPNPWLLNAALQIMRGGHLAASTSQSAVA